MRRFMAAGVVMVMAALVGCSPGSESSLEVTVRGDNGVFAARELVNAADAYLINEGVWGKVKWDDKGKKWEDNYTGARVDFYLDDAQKVATVTFRQTSKAGIVVTMDKEGQPVGYERVSFR